MKLPLQCHFRWNHRVHPLVFHQPLKSLDFALSW